jgi:hypothetical protein
MQRESLTDGSARLRGKSCAFLYTRLRPSALLVTIAGRDLGELGSAPLDEMDAEIARFGEPLELFIDTSRAEAVSEAVSEAWTAWFTSRRARLQRVEILARSRMLELTIAVSKHFSRTGELIRIHNDAARFEAAIAAAVPGWTGRPPPERLTEAPLLVRREVRPDGAVSITVEPGTFTLVPVSPTVLAATYRGPDSGQLNAMPFDEILRRYPADGSPITLLLDVRDTVAAADSVPEAWTAFFTAHRRRLQRILVLVRSSYLHFLVAMATHQSGTGDQLRVFTDAEKFERAAQRWAPGFTLPG